MGGSDTGGALGSLSNRFALDVQGFDAMRAEANASPQQGLKAAAKQFLAPDPLMVIANPSTQAANTAVRPKG